MSRSLQALLIAFTAALLGLSPGCQKQPANDPSAVAMELAQVNRRLQGDWVLIQADPQPPPEPALKSILVAQYNNLTVSFQGGNQIIGTGVGVNFKRRYEVVSSEFGRFTLALYDEYNTRSLADGEFAQDQLKIHGHYSPWTGSCVLRRK